MPKIKVTKTGKTVEVNATTAGDMIRNGFATPANEKAPAKKAETNSSKAKDAKS